jgi:hypothetical protein
MLQSCYGMVIVGNNPQHKKIISLLHFSIDTLRELCNFNVNQCWACRLES